MRDLARLVPKFEPTKHKMPESTTNARPTQCCATTTWSSDQWDRRDLLSALLGNRRVRDGSIRDPVWRFIHYVTSNLIIRETNLTIRV